MNKKVLLLFLICITFSCLLGCGASQREYNEDIVFNLQDGKGDIVIKEWSFLLGSGAEVYYKHSDGSEVLLGKTTGANDGFCPFKEGLYEIEFDVDAINIAWCFNPSDEDRSHWRSESFELPK